MIKKTYKKLKSGLNVLLWREDKWYISRCLEVEVASQGKSKKEALKNVEEALELYFEDEKLSPPKPFTDLELHSVPINA